MGKSIRLHKEFGLNPTICVCFYCGEDTGEMAMLGNQYKGEAPMRSCTSLKPCDNCKKRFKDHLLVVEVSSEEEPTPSGRWVAVHNSCVGEKFRNEQVSLCPHLDFEQLFGGNYNGEEEKQQ